jgi:hypothetical protein
MIKVCANLIPLFLNRVGFAHYPLQSRFGSRGFNIPMTISKYEVTTTIEALYWINKIWHSEETDKKKEFLTRTVIEHLSENIIEQVK